MKYSLEAFEYPLPKIDVKEKEGFFIKTSYAYDGNFTIINCGGGLLEGTIASNSEFIKVHPASFKSNQITIDFSLSMKGFQLGDMIRTSVLIISNGGELTVPVAIQIVPPELLTASHEPIYSLQAFAEYALKDPHEASFLFQSTNFVTWLEAMDYDKIETYTWAKNISHRQKAMDDFLVLNRLKEKATITYPKEIIIKLPPVPDIYHSHIVLERNGSGFVYTKLSSSHKAVKLAVSEIDEEAFKNSDFFHVPISIYPGLLTKPVTPVLIELEDFSHEHMGYIAIFITKESPIKAQLSRSVYQKEDEGILTIYTHFTEDVLVDISVSNSFIRFEANKYLVDKEIHIPFKIMQQGFLQASSRFFKRPYQWEHITVSATYPGGYFNKNFPIQIGGIPLSDKPLK